MNDSGIIFMRHWIFLYHFNCNLERFGGMSGPWKIPRVGGQSQFIVVAISSGSLKNTVRFEFGAKNCNHIDKKTDVIYFMTGIGPALEEWSSLPRKRYLYIWIRYAWSKTGFVLNFRKTLKFFIPKFSREKKHFLHELNKFPTNHSTLKQRLWAFKTHS